MKAGRGVEAHQTLVQVAQVLQATEEWNRPQTMHHIGLRFHQLGDVRAALLFFGRAAELLPGDRALNYSYSCALIRHGEPRKALDTFASTLVPWDGASTGLQVVDKHSDIAAAYDDNELHRFFSDRLIAAYANGFPGRRIRAALDLGCGTGQLGTKLPNSYTRLTGIDLTEEMITLARERGIYSDLWTGDLVQVMAGMSEPVDTVFAACVFPYIGDLSGVFAQAGRLLNPGGAFVFSVDPAPDSMEIGVTVTGEFSHSLRYLRGLAERHGLTERLVEVDRHRGPPGYWCAYGKA